MIGWAVTTGSETSLDSFPPSNRPESALNRVLRAHFYNRRFGPYESTYISRSEKRDLGRFRGILKKNRPKTVQTENDSQKGVPFPANASQTRYSGFGSSSSKESDYLSLFPERSHFHTTALEDSAKKSVPIDMPPLSEIITD